MEYVMNFKSISRIDKNICKLTNLRILDLEGNMLTRICKEIKMLKRLLKLNLSRNKLTKLCKGIAKIQNLIHFYIYFNYIQQTKDICRIYAGLRKITHHYCNGKVQIMARLHVFNKEYVEGKKYFFVDEDYRKSKKNICNLYLLN